MDYNEKRRALLEKYESLFRDQTGYTGQQLNNYVDELIKQGEKYYGYNFTEDILKEKRNDSILWLMNEIKTYANNDYSKAKVIDPREEWVQSLIKDSKMTESQARIFAGDPTNNLSYEIWLNERNQPHQESVIKKVSNPTLDKKQVLLDKHGDLIKRRIFGGHFNEQLDPIREIELNNSLDALIENGKLHYGEHFLDELINNDSKEDVAKVLRSLSLMPDEFNNPVDIPEDIDFSSAKTEPIEKSKTEPFQPPNNDDLAKAKLGKRKKAPAKLIDKFKNYWKDASFKKKLLIGAVAIGSAIGVATIAAVTISNIIATQSFDTQNVVNAGNMINHTVSLATGGEMSALDPNVVNADVIDPNAVVDFSNISNGTEVYTNINDALTNTNTLTSNEYMHVDHMEAVNQAHDVINLDNMTPNEVVDTLNNDDYAIRGSNGGTYMGWFSEDTVKDAIGKGGR